MSVLVGTAKRFASRGELNLRPSGALATTKPLPPRALEGLRADSSTTIEYADVQAQPIDGSNASLRELSPFTLKVEPPIIFRDSVFFAPGQRRKGDIFEESLTGRDLSQSSYAGIPTLGTNYFPGSAEEYIVRGQLARPNKVGATGEALTLNGQYSSRIGEASFAELYTALDIAIQLNAAQNTPPLTLLINPTDMSLDFEKVQTFTDQSRHEFLYHTWGESQPRLNINCKTGAFISGGRGVQFASKHDSVAWQQLMQLFALYKNNGYIHDTFGKSRAHHFVGGISISYDGWVYYGNMESFSWGYDESTVNGGIGFQIQFVVSNMTDTTQESFVQPLSSPTSSFANRRLEPREPSIEGGGSSIEATTGIQFLRQSVGGPSPRGIEATTALQRNSFGFRPPEASAPSSPEIPPAPFGPFRRR